MVPEKSGANSLMIGHSPPVINPYKNNAKIRSATTAVELQPIAVISARQIAGPINAIVWNIFLIVVFDTLCEVFLIMYAESGPPNTMVTPVARDVPALKRPFWNSETPKT